MAAGDANDRVRAGLGPIMSALVNALPLAAAFFGLATWIVPPLLLIRPQPKPRSSLAAVGRTIGVIVITATVSSAGLLLSLLAFIFSPRPGWTWFGLLAITGFWLSLGMGIVIGNRRSRTGA
jgi:hypothetical protein